MRLIAAFLLAPALIAGCGEPPPPSPTVGSVSHAGKTYPIRSTGADGQHWRVIVDSRPVTCRRPTEVDCYWSMRAYLNAISVWD